MELAVAFLAASALGYTCNLLGREFRALWVEWRVRRGLRLALAQEA